MIINRNVRSVAWVLAVSLLTSCAGSGIQQSSEAGAKITLIVKDSKHQFLAGVNVYGASRDAGEINLGVTNDAGVLLVPVRLVTSDDFLALIACKEAYYCSALRKDQELLLAADHSRLIHLELTPLTIH